MFLLISISVEEESRTWNNKKSWARKALKRRNGEMEKWGQWNSPKILEIVSIINIHCCFHSKREEKHPQYCELLLSSTDLTCVIYSNNCQWSEGMRESLIFHEGYWSCYDDDLMMRNDGSSDFLISCMQVSRRNKQKKLMRGWKWRWHVSTQAHRRSIVSPLNTQIQCLNDT